MAYDDTAGQRALQTSPNQMGDARGSPLPAPRSSLQRALLLPGVVLLVALALAILLAVSWLGAPEQDVTALIRYLLTSGGISLALGVAGVAWLRRGSGRLWLQVSLAYTLGVALALFNVFLTAQLMFISSHDLPLLVLLLVFAALVSLGLGVALARELAMRVGALHAGARAIAAGDLQARVDPVGSDELAALAREFNQMAALLAENERARARSEASRRGMMAAVSHDLRTPLASLRALTEALADGMVDDEATRRRYYATMRTQIGLLSRLIDDLFELGRIEAGALRVEPQRVSPGDLLSDTLEGLLPQARERGVELIGSVAPDVAMVLAEAQQIERVLANLVTNALRHTPAGGSVTLRVYAEQRPQTADGSSPLDRTAQPLAGAEPPSSVGRLPSIVFEVADTGDGIAPEDLPHVFERFYRGEKSRSRSTGGAGLGLAIARGIVEAHGGRIWAESEPGRGATVRFTLPQA
jgi:signal transduction histidine kinase